MRTLSYFHSKSAIIEHYTDECVYPNDGSNQIAKKVVHLIISDADLISRCQNDFAAFDDIVARYKDGIYNYIWRMISNPDDVEDLTQEVFVKAFGSIKRFRLDSNIKTWLYKIASNLCIDKYRRLATERKHIVRIEHEDDESEQWDFPDTSYDPEMIYARNELKEEVQRSLFLLPDKLRAAVLLFDIEGMSYEEISETLDCPIGTVKSRLFNARMQLRDLLRPYIEAADPGMASESR